MPFTLLDGIVLLVILISAVLAMIRGFTREVFSIGSWVAAAADAAGQDTRSRIYRTRS